MIQLWLERRTSHDHYIKLQLARAGLIQGELKQFISSPSGLKLLDIGSHRGGYSIFFAKLGYKVTGLEISRERIATAKQAAKEHHLAVEFVQGDARSTLFKNNQFDIIILSNTIEHIPDTIRLLQELYRILKPNGILYIQYPPYWGFFGSHTYLKSIPIPLHYLPGKLQPRLISWLNLDSEPIERVTIRKLKSFSKTIGFKILKIKTTPAIAGELALFCKAILQKPDL
ncbi:MAG TPA: class I SAM-dependent methyltransferase [Candidatus Nanoarchaeia archaeon]|nr:class I SAM-dependent methyltransferase [Candidatus Nanoarchaeia archaeon]